MTETSKKQDELFLELGDIINLVAPGNGDLNGKMFFIKYLDAKEISLVDPETLTVFKLGLDNGKLDDESIEVVEIISKSEEKGYARQNNLLPKSWITIQLSGEVPIIINGEITSLEEDMIEISTWPEKQKIYIDFAYKGVPKNLPIESIKPFIRPIEKEVVASPSPVFPEFEQDVDELSHGDTYPIEPEISEQRREILLDADDVVFGKKLEGIRQMVPVEETERRYGIKTQSDDMLNDLLSTIPTANRTKRVLNSIHIMIERYQQLRSIYSKLSEDGNVELPDTKTAQFKPLVNKLETLSKKLYWLLPIVKSNKVVYDVDADEEDETLDIKQTTLADAQNEIYDIMQQYKTNTVPDGENKYKFLYKQLNPLLTPFEESTNLTNVVISKPVDTVLNAVVSNFDDLYSSVFCDGILDKKRLVMERYETGLTYLSKLDTKKRKQNPTLQKLVQSDTMNIVGFMALTEPFVNYSQINLPATSIYRRAELNEIPFTYFDHLDKRTSVKSTIIEEDSAPINREDFLDNVEAFLFNQTKGIEDRNSKDYLDFLNTMVPKTKDIFNLVKKRIVNNTSYMKILLYLQPFLIYADDITFKQYEEIVNYMRTNILDLKKFLVTKNGDYLTYMNHKYDSWNVGFKNSYLFNMLKPQNQIRDGLDWKKAYGLKHDMTSEFIRKILVVDNGRLFMSSVALEDVELFVPIDVEAIINKKLAELKGEITEEKVQPGECKNFILSKYYIDIDSLREDDGNSEIYFDSKYDDTRYDIIEEFSNEQNSMDPKAFNNFLVQHLMNNVGLDILTANKEADAMINKKRKVVEGDYSYIIDERHDNIYYIRDDNKTWIRVKEMDGELPSASTFCNLKKSCVSINNECGDMVINKNKIKEQLINEMLEQFDKDFHLNMDELVATLKTNKNYNISIIESVVEISKLFDLRYDYMKYAIGELLPDRAIISSPHEPLRNLILSQDDFVRKQTDIIKFVNKVCRPSQEDEDPYWFYCIKTNIKLLPTFYKDLASAYFNGSYIRMLENVSAARGEKSDDGDKIVDKYSGYLIRMLEFDGGEGYDETGYKIVSRSIMENDIGDVLMDMSFKPTDTLRSKDGDMIRKVIFTLETQMSVQIGSEVDFIIKNVENTLDVYLPTEDEFKSQKKIAKGRGTNLGNYVDIHDEALLFLTLGYFLVVTQTMMPAIRTKKTFKGCGPRSFKGYPLEGSGDYSALKYLSCVALRLRSRTRPWQRLPKLTREKASATMKSVMTKLKTLIDKEILSKDVIKDKINDKIRFLQSKPPDTGIISEFDVKAWRTFLPPLHPINITGVQTLGKTFKEDLYKNIREGNSTQFQKMALLYGKITLFSLLIQEQIQRVVDKEELLVRDIQNELLVENSCCNNGSKNTVTYFEEKESDIRVVNIRVKEYEQIYNFVQHINIPDYLFDPTDTKFKYPKVPEQFSEKTIYMAIIRFCYYNTGFVLDEKLRNVCGLNSSEFKKTDDIERKIEIMKGEGNIYTMDHFTRLMNIVNKENILNINLRREILSPRSVFEHLIKNEVILDDVEGTDLETFMKLTADVLDRFEMLREEGEGKKGDAVNILENFIKTKTDSLMTEIIDFTELTAYRPLLDFFNTIDNWKLKGENIYMSLEDETAVSFYTYSSTYIANILKIYPTIIKNEVDYKFVKMPIHWQKGAQKMGDNHIKDIQHIISEEHRKLYEFYGKKDINSILDSVVRSPQTNAILLLVKLLPFFANIRLLPDSPRSSTIMNGDMIKSIMKFLTAMAFQEYIVRTKDHVSGVSIDLEEEIFEGQKMEIRHEVSNLLTAYLSIMAKEKDITNISNYEIDQEILKSKEKEKAKVTKRLGDLSVDERKVQDLMKNHRLGDWGLGQTRALFVYDEDQYDKERLEIENDILNELVLGNMDGVSERNREIFMMDDLEQRIIGSRVQQELNADMAFFGGDDENGELDN
jgi:hypothetical protein